MTAENKPKHDMSTTAGKLADLRDRYHEAVFASGEAAIAKQHAKGKKTARERIELLLDEGSFEAVSYTHLTLPTTSRV